MIRIIRLQSYPIPSLRPGDRCNPIADPNKNSGRSHLLISSDSSTPVEMASALPKPLRDAPATAPTCWSSLSRGAIEAGGRYVKVVAELMADALSKPVFSKLLWRYPSAADV
jgi:hypothetical protein